MFERPPISMDIDEGEGIQKQREHFMGRFPELTPFLEKITELDLSEAGLIRAIEQFNKDKAELVGAYDKDYIKLENGKTIAMYWDDKGTIRLGYS